MAITAADIRVKFSSEGAGAVRSDITGVGGAVDSVQGKLSSWGKNLRTTGAWLTAGVTTPLVAFFTTAINGASSLEQAQGKVDAVFKNSADVVQQWSKTTADSIGVSETQALQWTGTIGNFFTSAGIAHDQAAQMSQDFITLSADMAAFNDVSAARASDALISGLAGEYDALQRLGINIKAATVEEEALAIAMADGREEVTENDRALARYNVIMRESANQHGQFKREATGFAGQLAILKAQFSELVTEIGGHLIPHATAFIGVLRQLVAGIDALSPSMQRWAVGLGLAAAALGPLLIAIGLMLPGLGVMIGLFAAMVSPIGLVVAAVAALAVVFRGPLMSGLRRVGSTVKDAIDAFRDMWDSLSGVTKVVEVSEGFYASWTRTIEVTTSAVNTLSRFLLSLGAALRVIADATGWAWIGAVADGLDTLAGKIEFATNVFQNLRATGVEPLEAAFRTLETMFPRLSGSFDGLRAVVEALQFSFDAFRNGEWEAGFQRLGNVAESAWSRIREGISLIGQVAQAFGSWVLDVGVPTVTGWIVDFAADAWGALKSAAGVALVVAATLGAWVLDTGIPIIVGWLADAAGNVWNALTDAAGWVWAGVVDLGGWVLNVAAPTAGGWLSSLASNVWNGLVSAAGWAWAGVVDLGSWVLNVAAPTTGGWLSSLAGNIWNGLVSAAGWVWSGVVDMPSWVLNTAAPTVAGWLTDVGSWLRTKIVEGLASFGITSTDLITVGTSIAAALGDAVTLGLQAVADFGATILTWLTEQMQGVDWNSLGNTIGTKVGEAIKAGIIGIAALVGLGAVLLAELLIAIVNVDWSSLGSSIKAFLQTALEAGFDFATGFIQGLFTGLFDGISFDTITSKGAELVQSFTNGFEIAWPATQAWIASLPGKAVEAIGELGETLKSKGAELIQGFWDGAKEVWNDFIDWLTGRDEEMGKIEPGTGGDDPNIIGSGNAFVGDWSQFPGMGGLSGLGSSMGSAMSDALESVRAAAETGMESIRGTIESKSAEWGSALSAGTSNLTSIASAAFSGLQAVATPPMVATGAMVAAQTSLMMTSAATNWGAMAMSAMTQFPAMQVAGTTAAAAMNIGVTAAATAMNVGVTASVNAMRATSTAAVAGMQAGIAASMLLARTTATSNAQTMATNVVNAMRLMATGVAAAVRNGMNQVPQIIASVGAFAASVARGVGAQIGNGLAEGMESALGRIRAAAAAMISAALIAAQAKAIISSPSKLFEREVGVHISEGVAEGIDRASGVVQRAVSDMLDVNGLLDRLAYLVNEEVIGAVRNSVPPVGSHLNPFTIGVPATASRGTVHIDARTTFQPGSIVQRPGEDAEALARRIADMRKRDLESVIGAIG